MDDRPTLALGEPFEGAWSEQPWPLAIEVAGMLPEHSWTIVGGLMVQTHAHLNGLEVSRATSDVDAVLHLETKQITFAHAQRALTAEGFTLADSDKYAYRFDRDGDQVDVMVSDRYAARFTPRFGSRFLFPVPAGTRALSETSNLVLQRAGTDLATFSLPSLRGALALKGAAYLEDARDRERHLEDGIVLLACVRDVAEVREGLTRRSRKRIRSLITALSDNRRAWRSIPGSTVRRARANLDEMGRAFDVHGTDNSWTRTTTTPRARTTSSSGNVPQRPSVQ